MRRDALELEQLVLLELDRPRELVKGAVRVDRLEEPGSPLLEEQAVDRVTTIWPGRYSGRPARYSLMSGRFSWRRTSMTTRWWSSLAQVGAEVVEHHRLFLHVKLDRAVKDLGGGLWSVALRGRATSTPPSAS